MSERWAAKVGGAVRLAACAGLLAGSVGLSADEKTPHWAYRSPGPVMVPASEDGIRNPIDAFVARRLHRQGLDPLGSADRQTLIRRVTLDLLGVPPTPGETDAFLADRRPGAWERLVDRLLASPRYGGRCRGWMRPGSPTATATSGMVVARRGAGATG